MWKFVVKMLGYYYTISERKKNKTKIVEFLFFLRKKWDIYLPVGMRWEFLGYCVYTTHIIHLTVRDGYIIRISWLVSCSLNQVFMVLSSDELNCKSETQYIGMCNLCTEVKSRSNCTCNIQINRNSTVYIFV